MKIATRLKNRNFTKSIGGLLILMVLVAVVGFSDATYLTYKYFVGTPVVCPIFGDGCFKVAESKYADLFGIPTPLLGSIFYVTLLALIHLYFLKEKKVVLRMISALSLAGFLVSLSLTYVQAYILRSFCFYCLVSATSSFLIFILGSAIFFLSRKKRT